MRHRDIHLLTVGRYTYTSDQRFEALHSPYTEEWTLKIRYPQLKDSGYYECQISTTPPIGHAVFLTIVGEYNFIWFFYHSRSLIILILSTPFKNLVNYSHQDEHESLPHWPTRVQRFFDNHRSVNGCWSKLLAFQKLDKIIKFSNYEEFGFFFILFLLQLYRARTKEFVKKNLLTFHRKRISKSFGLIVFFCMAGNDYNFAIAQKFSHENVIRQLLFFAHCLYKAQFENELAAETEIWMKRPQRIVYSFNYARTFGC